MSASYIRPVAPSTFNNDITVGDGTGSPDLDIDKDPDDIGELRFLVAGKLKWTFTIDGSEVLNLKRYDDAGSFVDNTININDATGNINLSAGLTLNSATGVLTVGTGAGAAGFKLDGSGSGYHRVQTDTQWSSDADTYEETITFNRQISSINGNVDTVIYSDPGVDEGLILDLKVVGWLDGTTSQIAGRHQTNIARYSAGSPGGSAMTSNTATLGGATHSFTLTVSGSDWVLRTTNTTSETINVIATFRVQRADETVTV